jgi:hypothetical protein
VTLEVGALLAVMGKYNKDSPRLQKLTAQTMERVTNGRGRDFQEPVSD